ncbi:MAG TPA: glycosyltransferase family 2 protein [Longimicrobium sp.]|nr:glycosyltransferase family 2 protein [Longimicrobium sp.]
MSAAPPLTIGLPVYNGERLLPAALEALLGQTFTDFELLLSDNVSTDATREICEAAAARDPRVRYVRQPEPLPVVDHFRWVLREARSERFMWAADDDLREPGQLGALMGAMDRNPRAVLASSYFDVIGGDGLPARDIRTGWEQVFRGPRLAQMARMIVLDEVGSHKAVHIYGLARRDALVRAVHAVSQVPPRSGWDVCALLHLLGQGDVEIVPQTLFHYRVHAGRADTAGSVAAEAPVRFLASRVRAVAADLGRYRAAYLQPNREYFAGMRTALRGHDALRPLERAGLAALTRVRQPLRATRIVAGVVGKNLRIAAGRLSRAHAHG